MFLKSSNLPKGSGRYAWPLALCYVSLIVYGTLYPFHNWHLDNASLWQLLALPWPRYISSADLVINFLAYIPLGLCLGWALLHLLPPRWVVLIAVAVGFFLSVTLEALQGALPSRVPSLLDVLANSGGTFVGAFLTMVFGGSTFYGQKLVALRRELFVDGRLSNIGLSAVGLWTLAQLSPLIPSFDVDNLRYGMKPLWYALRDSSLFSFQGAFAYAFGVTAISAIVCSLGVPGKNIERIIPCFFGIILLFNVPIVERQLTLEAIIGSIVGISFFFLLFKKLKSEIVVLCTAFAILICFVLDGLLPSINSTAGPSFQKFNLVPFVGQMQNIAGLTDLLLGFWPFFALSYLVLQWQESRIVPTIVIVGALLIFMISFGVEWAQRTIPGRSPDLTDVIIAIFAWLLPFFLCRSGSSETLH